MCRALRAQLVEETEHFRPVKPEAEGVKKQVYTGPNIEEATFVHYEHNPEVRRSLHIPHLDHGRETPLHTLTPSCMLCCIFPSWWITGRVGAEPEQSRSSRLRHRQQQVISPPARMRRWAGEPSTFFLQQFKDADRVYLPVYWVGLVRDGPDGWRAALQKFIRTLDTRCGGLPAV